MSALCPHKILPFSDWNNFVEGVFEKDLHLGTLDLQATIKRYYA